MFQQKGTNFSDSIGTQGITKQKFSIYSSLVLPLYQTGSRSGFSKYIAFTMYLNITMCIAKVTHQSYIMQNVKCSVPVPIPFNPSEKNANDRLLTAY